MSKTEMQTIGKILADHYALQGGVSDIEIKDEIRSLARKKAKGSLDDRARCLAVTIHVATGRDVIELHKGHKS